MCKFRMERNGHLATAVSSTLCKWQQRLYRGEQSCRGETPLIKTTPNAGADPGFSKGAEYGERVERVERMPIRDCRGGARGKTCVGGRGRP